MTPPLLLRQIIQQGDLTLPQESTLTLSHNNKIVDFMLLRYNHLIQQHYRQSKLMDQSALNFIYFLAVVGGIVFVLWFAKLLWALIKAILPAKNFPQRYGKKSWAVVTGGSDGIGLGFCQELSSLGFNICMIARNRTKMEAALATLREKREEQEIQTKLIIADFAQSDQQDFFATISRQLQGLDISILVNNVGISNIGNFHQISQKRLKDQINVNILPMTLLSHMLIPRMLRRQSRSAIINLSSVAGQNPLPYISVYSSTKAYNDFFSQSLEMQYSSKIDILSVRPMYVESNLSKMKKSCTVASRNQCAQASLKYLGLDYETNGFYMHRLLAYTTTLLPTPMLRCVSESQSRKVMVEEEKRAAQNAAQ